jgi:hypothetical protein
LNQEEFLKALRGTTPLDVLDAFEDDDEAPTQIQSLSREGERAETPFSGGTAL